MPIGSDGTDQKMASLKTLVPLGLKGPTKTWRLCAHWARRDRPKHAFIGGFVPIGPDGTDQNMPSLEALCLLGQTGPTKTCLHWRLCAYWARRDRPKPAFIGDSFVVDDDDDDDNV